MNLLERELHYPFGDTLPAPGRTFEVAPGVRWLRMALPFALDHINLWLLRDSIDGVRGLDGGRLLHRARGLARAVGAGLRDTSSRACRSCA